MTTTFDELHQQIIKRTLKQMDLRCPQSISGFARSVYEKEDRYWERLEATELCGDTSKEWCNETTDG